jgi:stalled ribosome rescue protein Dom34
MKAHESRTFAGVWMDHQTALLITTEDHQGHGDYAVRKKIHSHGHAAHGSSEHTSNHKNKAEAEKFYKEIAQSLEQFHDILIFGPGKAQEELFNHLKENKHFHGRNLSIDSAGNITENQMIAKVRDFFKPFVHSH